MYWKDIGTTTDAVFAHTYAYNLIYGRPIYPLGQVYSDPPAHQIIRFRELSRAYGAAGVSWWDWQEAPLVGVDRAVAAGRHAARLRPVHGDGRRSSKGAQGDLVVWAQEHLDLGRLPRSASTAASATTPLRGVGPSRPRTG